MKIVARKLTESSARHILDKYYNGYGTILIDGLNKGFSMVSVEEFPKVKIKNPSKPRSKK